MSNSWDAIFHAQPDLLQEIQKSLYEAGLKPHERWDVKVENGAVIISRAV